MREAWWPTRDADALHRSHRSAPNARLPALSRTRPSAGADTLGSRRSATRARTVETPPAEAGIGDANAPRVTPSAKRTATVAEASRARVITCAQSIGPVREMSRAKSYS